MATCTLTSGMPIACLESTGGLKNVYISAFDDAVVVVESGDVISALTNAGTFYTFKFRAQNGGFNEEGNHSIENGTNFYTQTLDLTFHKKETSKRNNLTLLAGTQMHVIVETQNGDFWFMGEKNGAYLTASSSQTGQAYGDLSGYTISIQADEPFMAKELTTVAMGLLTLAA